MDNLDLDWARGVDQQKPNPARIYDYNIGGKNYFAADRNEAERLAKISPYVRSSMQENRYFLGRAVRYLAGLGITQFLDLGTGLPTQNNVHQVAQAVTPAARVVYVDMDPVVLSHARALTAHDDKVRVIAGDVRDIDQILNDQTVVDFLDWDAPLAVLLIGVLHFITDDYHPDRILAHLRERMHAGSYLAISHGTTDYALDLHAPGTAEAFDIEWRAQLSDVRMRSLVEVSALFDGFDLLPPGVVLAPEWRPDGINTGHEPGASGLYAGIGRKSSDPVAPADVP